MRYVVKWAVAKSQTGSQKINYLVQNISILEIATFREKTFHIYEEAKQFKKDLDDASHTIGIRYYQAPRIEVEE